MKPLSYNNKIIFYLHIHKLIQTNTIFHFTKFSSQYCLLSLINSKNLYTTFVFIMLVTSIVQSISICPYQLTADNQYID